MKNKHIKEILSILSSSSYTTAETLAKKLNVSEKTIRLNIQNINNELNNIGISISSKPRYGYILINDNNDCHVKNLDFINAKLSMFNDAEYRTNYIFKYLINNKDHYFKIDLLIEALDISKTTFAGTLKIIEENIKYYNLKIDRKPNYGIKLIGDEFNIRNCIIGFLLNRESSASNEYFNENLSNIIIDFIQNNNINLSEVNLDNFIKYISVAIERIKNNNFISEYDKNILNDINDEELLLSHNLSKKIEEAENSIKFTDEEIVFIAIHIASKISLSTNSNLNCVINNELDNIVKDMLNLVFENLKIDFRNDLNIRLLLNQHLIPLNIRIKYNIFQTNPMINDIKSNYGLAYLIALEAATILKKYYNNKEISDDEIGYFALLFQIGLENKKDEISKINILIVCGSGKTTSNLLSYKYKREFNEYIDEIYITDLIGLANFDFSKVNYIFSTVPISIKIPIPIVYISLFLENNDIINVKKCLQSSKNDFLDDYFKDYLFSTNIEGNSKEIILKNICKDIKKYYDIPDNFYDSVMKREKLSETDFGNLVAIPHPFELLTENTFVYVAVLDEPIMWYKNNVQIIFLVSVSNKKDDNLQKFYEYTVDFLLNENSVKKLIENKTFDNLLYLLKNN